MRASLPERVLEERSFMVPETRPPSPKATVVRRSFSEGGSSRRTPFLSFFFVRFVPSWRIRLLRGVLSDLLVCSLIAIGVHPALAQGTGQIGGTVRDEQGGVLPGVTLVLRNEDSGVARTVTSEP